FLWERYLLGGTVEVGDLIHVPEQGEALRLIARDGAAAFYEGPIAEAIVRAVQRDGGLMTIEDLRGYRAVDMEPLRFEVAGAGVGADGETFRFVTMPPPSSGGITMGQALGLLGRTWHPFEGSGVIPTEGEVLNGCLDPETPDDSVAAMMSGGRGWSMQRRDALLFECFQFAFADRAAWLGDPAFVDVPTERLLSAGYLDRRAALIDLEAAPRAADEYLEPDARIELAGDAGTSHLSAVDRWGNAVACTETINTEFGCLLAVPEYGFLLNDQMDDFTTRLGEPNAYGLRQSARNLPEAGKRPLSSMTPTIVLDEGGRVRIVAGASGGPRIITGTTLAILHAINGWSAREAVAAPRFHHQWMPARLDMEPAYAGLSWQPHTHAMWVRMDEGQRARGYEVNERDNLCVVQLIRRDDRGFWEAASDPRKGGRPAGD
ncbi:MAG: gamma-glutamyltransferase, partial [Phycisphaerales bacterium]|nr:gamma-glutamyltransferase [Phycisphaerales bacterium]